jgi:hypothetical protein
MTHVIMKDPIVFQALPLAGFLYNYLFLMSFFKMRSCLHPLTRVWAFDPLTVASSTARASVSSPPH